MARELPFAGSTPWFSASAPAASVVVLGTMLQLHQHQAAVPSTPSPYDPSDWRNVWSVDESSPTSSILGGSPVESLAGCNETESEEDECNYTAGLAEQIAHSMLDDDERLEDSLNSVAWMSEQIKVPAWNVQIALSASPQSTLAGFEWCGSKRSIPNSVASSNRSSHVTSQGSSPSSAVLEGEDDAWDLLYAAAGEVAKLSISEERRTLATTLLPPRAAGGTGLSRVTQQHRQLPSCLKQSVSSMSLPSPGGGSAKDFPVQSRSLAALSSGSPCYRDKPSMLPSDVQRSTRAKARDEERGNASQYCRTLKQGATNPVCRRGGRHRLLQPSNGGGGRQKGGGGSVHRSSIGTADFLSSLHFPPLGQQQQAFLGGNGGGSAVGSGMRAVFLGATGSRESGGTGVFLPRRIGCGSETKKKPACSTVLLPSRIVEALNLNMEGVLSGPTSPPIIPASRRGLSLPAASLRPNLESSAVSARPGGADLAEWTENRWTAARPACSPIQEVTSEINLPTEWTY